MGAGPRGEMKPIGQTGVYRSMPLSENVAQVWAPLPATEWNAAAARHLLRRIGWTARGDEVARAVAEGLPRTLERAFPAEPLSWAKPPLLVKLETDGPPLMAQARAASGEEKRATQKELRERSQGALQEMRIAWLRLAAQPELAARAKWQLFLSDVYVVSAEKVHNPLLVWRHFDTLARGAMGAAPALTKAVSRSPAMELYLDLQESRREAPNENFARELFELFVLGEGHYTERDIKEAARAFTGYRVRQPEGEFRFAPKQHDAGTKTVFGRAGAWRGDDVIDLAYAQPAAATFLPGELAKFYLSDRPLPAEVLAALGETWRADGFSLAALARTFFGSRLFFAEEFRGNFIKSPVQFYLGLVQDLDLTVAPITRATVAPLRQMGQQLFQPPNVRGWVGGRMWINSATLAARRQLVQQAFGPLHEEKLNADEQRALAEVRAERPDAAFVVPPTWTAARADAGATAAVEALWALAGRAEDGAARAALAEFLEKRPGAGGVRDAAIALLQSPDYQLC